MVRHIPRRSWRRFAPGESESARARTLDRTAASLAARRTCGIVAGPLARRIGIALRSVVARVRTTLSQLSLVAWVARRAATGPDLILALSLRVRLRRASASARIRGRLWWRSARIQGVLERPRARRQKEWILSRLEARERLIGNGKAARPPVTTVRVNAVHRIIVSVDIEVVLASVEAAPILACPPPHARVVIPRSETHEARIGVVEPPGESKRNPHVPSG